MYPGILREYSWSDLSAQGLTISPVWMLDECSFGIGIYQRVAAE